MQPHRTPKDREVDFFFGLALFLDDPERDPLGKRAKAPRIAKASGVARLHISDRGRMKRSLRLIGTSPTEIKGSVTLVSGIRQLPENHRRARCRMDHRNGHRVRTTPGWVMRKEAKGTKIDISFTLNSEGMDRSD